MEEWRTIVEFPTYEVSNTGKVRNAKTGRVLKPGTSAGYPMCNLYKNRKVYIPRHKEFGGAALGRKFGVSRAQISKIINNKSRKGG